MKKDYYKILGVEKTATEDDIKKAFRQLAHKYHPDKSGGDEKKFKEINEAYQILSNKERRAQYDRFGTIFDGQSGEGAPGFDFHNFSNGFEFGFDPSQFGGDGFGLGEMFDSIFEGLGVKKRKTYHRGADLEVMQEISLEEAFIGLRKKISYKSFVVCAECGGVGHFPKAGFDDCSACDGRGEIRENRRGFFGSFTQVKVCVKCAGNGKIPKKSCYKCSGTGRVLADRLVEVDIRPGVASDQILKLAGAGEVGERGAEAGDLYLHIKVETHALFQREGDNLLVKKEMNLLDLVLGKKIDLTTLDKKKIEVDVPAGFNLGQRLEVVGQGMPRFGSGGKGSLFVEFIVKKPVNLSEKAKKLVEELKKEVGN